MMDRFAFFERVLVSKGWPATSPWWMGTLEGFELSGKRQLVARVGRRGGKSSTICRVAAATALSEHKVPPGDVGVVAIISTSRDEAAQRVRTIKGIFDALGIGYRPIDHGIELLDRPIAIKTFVASIAGVSGFTAVCVICDEVAKWKDADTGANPATEVLSSLRPTLATQPSARIYLSSSAFGTDDAHATAFTLGDTAFQATAFAESWVANPTLTEQGCRELEPDPKVFDREYRCVPQGSTTLAFDMAMVSRAIRPLPLLAGRGRTYMAMDSSQGRGDSFVWCGANYVRPAGADSSLPHLMDDLFDQFGNLSARQAIPRRDENGVLVPNPNYGRQFPQALHIFNIDGLDGKFDQIVEGDDVLDMIAKAAKKNDARTVFSDQFMQFMIGSGLRRRKLEHVYFDWQVRSKVDAVARLRQLFREDRIIIQPGPQAERLRKEFATFPEKISPDGSLTYGKRNGRDDRIALVLCLMMADTEGLLAGSVIAKRNTVTTEGAGY